MKSKYILLKDLPIPIQMEFKFLLNEIIISLIHSKTFSLPTKIVII